MTILEIISSPIVSNILILVGIVFLALSIFRENVGITLTISLVSFLIYLLASIYSGEISLIIFALFLIGGLFLLLEILMPGIGIFAVLGAVLLVIGFIFPEANLIVKFTSFSIALVLTLIAGVFFFKQGFRNERTKKIILEDEIQEKSKDMSSLIKQRGISLTPLRPAGTIRIDGKKYDALTDGFFIEKGKEIVVIRTEGKKIFVETINN